MEVFKKKKERERERERKEEEKKKKKENERRILSISVDPRNGDIYVAQPYQILQIINGGI